MIHAPCMCIPNNASYDECAGDRQSKLQFDAHLHANKSNCYPADLRLLMQPDREIQQQQQQQLRQQQANNSSDSNKHMHTGTTITTTTPAAATRTIIVTTTASATTIHMFSIDLRLNLRVNLSFAQRSSITSTHSNSIQLNVT